MSYDLLFCTDTYQPVTKETISEYLGRLPYMTDEWTYQNPNTGVYFSFFYNPTLENEIETEIPSGYYDTHLSFNLNYNRPKFFADEAMPYVEQLCNSLGFLVIDPQGQEVGGKNLPLKATADGLIESWMQSNKGALSAYKLMGGLPAYLPREKSTEWWKYQMQVEGIKKHLSDSIYVPNIFLFADTKENKVKTAITWTEAIPFLLPMCDKVIIARLGQKGLFRRNQQVTIKGWIDSEEVKGKIMQYMNYIETEGGLLPILPPEKSPLVKALFAGLKTSPIPDQYKRISSDNMIDEEVR